jgi:hypothetical protein
MEVLLLELSLEILELFHSLEYLELPVSDNEKGLTVDTQKKKRKSKIQFVNTILHQQEVVKVLFSFLFHH